jgi:hypothetical protein
VCRKAGLGALRSLLGRCSGDTFVALYGRVAAWLSAQPTAGEVAQPTWAFTSVTSGSGPGSSGDEEEKGRVKDGRFEACKKARRAGDGMGSAGGGRSSDVLLVVAAQVSRHACRTPPLPIAVLLSVLPL